ncbi:hypothetical protein EMIHUDRAFT_317967 [Emiliania huxleyi CCMP1516]|uniref:Ubiquitin-like domain-containing protein n=2 Tax=Emiliania huxleyi TaxID=2903 RepID=A0A0D3ILY8_EMIH1|nr:hypothetical protein EMIHUDRAFT_317967 [Emiliania huxleyi CCMP1516]EOD12273.1 hypothetical protein EMIHUDRAFT_317967 [Emiliania huxleyi CCMP1516]|eukprot:XP_005764702.1 hypothetical protein EMIHUDRAFT_317967 [Emiliania huxleyi CCMP1516]
MGCTVKLVGPDMTAGMELTMALQDTICDLRKAVYDRLAAASAPANESAGASAAPAGAATAPQQQHPKLEQLRVIYQGRFVSDDKPIKGARPSPLRVPGGGRGRGEEVAKLRDARPPPPPPGARALPRTAAFSAQNSRWRKEGRPGCT